MTETPIGIMTETPQIDYKSQISNLEEALKEANDKKESIEKENKKLINQLREL